jgi:glycosyltransferase involved in cell wall biosynthesis
MRRSIAFVGPLPPPLNGFSNVCAMMLAMLRLNGEVHVFDRAPKHKQPRQLITQLLLPLQYAVLCLRRRDVVLYLALSGAFGQIYDWLYVLISKVLRRPIYIHHHSFAYIHQPTRLNHWFFAWVRNANHVVLSRSMGEALVALYGLDPACVKAVSNAAFYTSAEASRPVPAARAPLQLGYLSNITFEKGIVEFFSILDRLRELQIEYRAHIAGPVAEAARETFEKLLSSASQVEYVGPVFGEAKDAFYRQLDVFLFPTKYANEAEPLVVYEAMRQGVYVIACDRGAISEMLRNGAGVAYARDQIIESAAAQIATFDRDRELLRSAQKMSALQAQRIRTSGRTELDTLLNRMQGATPSENCTGVA